MRIISRYHDYYDSVMGVAFDEDILYKRKETDPVFTPVNESHRGNYFEVTFFCIAGKVYPMYKLFYQNLDLLGMKAPYTLDHRYNTHYYFRDKEAILKCFRKKGMDDKWLRKELIDGSTSWYSSVDQYIDIVTPQIAALSTAPVFKVFKSKYSTHYIVENPCLKNSYFQSVLPPFEIYQELVMYIGGMANAQYPPVEIVDDIVKRDKAGFDNISFKNIKGHKRGRNK